MDHSVRVLEEAVLPSTSMITAKDIQSRSITVGDLDMHILEAFPEGVEHAPLLVLLHGFPELAYSWRKVIGPLADAGYHVVAPDQRGYGRTVSRDSPARRIDYGDDLSPFQVTNLVKDVLGLVFALGYRSAAAVVGHDFGSPVAAYCALIRPDVFQSVVLMSAPFAGPPALSPSPASSDFPALAGPLAELNPPRKHYMLYFSTDHANKDLIYPPEGLRSFLRNYFFVKSADWTENAPKSLSGPLVPALASLPDYYVMPLHASMPEAVRPYQPSEDDLSWFPEDDLDFYVQEFSRTGFQGGLNSYRVMTSRNWQADLELFAGMQIVVPAMFLAGKEDWGTYQRPGGVEAMCESACAHFDALVLVEGAGHWVQQEQGERVVEEIVQFVQKHSN
ncbi:unnamed protein product [Mycena citricolor]|uniref:AB hydrolase-1 domain-containing protein n=1 Tax=Mycena citricolor TaxID=2018698 RepID=A0AAD2GS15_9AGAR|nr:unnamed protein product [Mycena citricolor]